MEISDFLWIPPDFHQKPPDFHRRPPDFPWRPLDVRQKPQYFIGDPRYSKETSGFLSLTPTFFRTPLDFYTPRFLSDTSILYWRSLGFKEKIGVSNKNLGVSDEILGVSDEKLGISYASFGSETKFWGL